MVGHKPNQITLGKIATMNDVASELQRLNKSLENSGLDQFIIFNGAYLIVTTSVQHAIEDNYFKNPQFIEKFIVTFASYYFSAINDTLSNRGTLSLPWATVNEYSKYKSAPTFISLMLGANAHINNDLPQVLKKLMEKEKTEDLLSDIVKIDKLLMESGKEIIGTFEEKNKTLDFLKRRLQFTYYRPAMYTIRYWRIIAWRNYRKLKKDPTHMQIITKRSIKIANHWLLLSKALAKTFGS